MKTQKLVARVPLNYNDFGALALSEHGRELFDSMIASKLPDSCSWCGNEIIGDYDVDYDFDIDEIISECAEKIMAMEDESIFDNDLYHT